MRFPIYNVISNKYVRVYDVSLDAICRNKNINEQQLDHIPWKNSIKHIFNRIPMRENENKFSSEKR